VLRDVLSKFLQIEPQVRVFWLTYKLEYQAFEVLDFAF
jgi:hypothetical protein